MGTNVQVRREIGNDRPIRTSKFRADIEGLRAIAVLLVLLWHAGVSQLPGGFIGVDVFFVLSGFFMTGILHRELSRSGRVSLSKFYARRARRLIPASTFVLVVTALAVWFVLPPTRWWVTGQDIAAAGGYLLNWLLASGSVDYLAQDAAASPVQHFWSLSVEEQYYIVWPLLIVAVGWACRRFRMKPTACVLAILIFTFVVSLSWSIIETPIRPGPAYFITTTRMWELALGGIVALIIPMQGRLNRAAAATLGWIGVGVIMATAFVLTPDTPFPGYVALIPTLATAMIIAVGVQHDGYGPVVVLKTAPFQFIGRLSYSLYLWHWPVLVIGGYLVTGGIGSLSTAAGIMLVLLSAIPAVLSYYFIEMPFRDPETLGLTTRRSIAVGLAGILIALIAGSGISGAGLLAERAAPEPLFTSTTFPVDYGAEALAQGRVDTLTAGQDISPSPVVAADDNPPVYARGCQQPLSSSKPVACEFGNADAPVTVVLVGDSHAAHWVDALSYVAEQRGWRLLSFTKSSCALIDATVINRGVPAPKCTEWNKNVRQELARIKPQAVFTSNIDYEIAGAENSAEAMVDGMAGAWRDVAADGTPVYVLRDSPASGVDPADCLAGHLNDPLECATDRSIAFGARGLSQIAAAKLAPVTLIDITESICPSDPCSPVIGGVMVYRDRTHMTATYSRSLGPTLDRRIPTL